MGIRRTTLAVEEIGFISPALQVKNLSEETGLPYLETIDLEKIDVELLRPLSLMLVREQLALPLWKTEDDQIEVAIADPSSLSIIDKYRIFYGQSISPILCPKETLPNFINQAFDRATQSASDVMEEMEREGEVENNLDWLEDIFIVTGGQSRQKFLIGAQETSGFTPFYRLPLTHIPDPHAGLKCT